MKAPRHALVPTIAIVSLTLIETLALLRGIDGVALSATVGAIGLIGGAKLNTFLNKDK